MLRADKVTQFYNRIAGLYPLIDLFLKPYKKHLKKVLSNLPKGHILDVGTGHGSLFNLGLNHQITGIDSSQNMLAVAKKKHPQAMLQKMNATKLVFEDKSFEYVVLAHVISTAPIKPTLQEAQRVLKNNGRLVILNHFSQKGVLGVPSKLFSFVSTWFAFSSSIKLEDVVNHTGFGQAQVLNAGFFGFYKLIILTKA